MTILPPMRETRKLRARVGGSEVPLHAADPWENALAAYLRDCRRRNLSSKTVELYESIIGGTVVTAYRLRGGVQLATFTARTLEDFEGTLLDEGRAPSTVHMYHRTLKTFVLWAVRRGLAAPEAAEAVRSVVAPMVPEGDIRPFTEAEERRLLIAAKRRGLRDELAVVLLLRGGLRATELAQLTEERVIWLPGGHAYLDLSRDTTKGRKQRWVPLDSPAVSASTVVERYLRASRAKGGRPTTVYGQVDLTRDTTRRYELLLSSRRSSRTGDYEPLTRSAIRKIVGTVGELAGVADCHPHRFRHHFATRALDGGVKMHTLQQVLGHSTPKMVMRYARASGKDVLADFAQRTN